MLQLIYEIKMLKLTKNEITMASLHTTGLETQVPETDFIFSFLSSYGHICDMWKKHRI